MTLEEYEAAFLKGSPIKVETRTGRTYWLHHDQLSMIRQGAMVCGVPVDRNMRRHQRVQWLKPENLKLVDDDQ